MKLAINGQQLAATHTLEQLLDVAESFGVTAVELWPANVPGGGTDEEHERWETKAVTDAATLLQKRGVAVACVTLGFWALPMCLKRGGASACSEALCGAVDATVTLGAKLVNCYMTRLSPDAFLAAVRPAADYAAKRGVVITLENEAHDDAAEAVAVAALVRAVDSPGFRTQYDPCNYYHAYQEAYPDAYEILQPHIGYVHLKGGGLWRDGRTDMYRGSLMRGAKTERIGYVPLPEAAFPVAAIVNRLCRDGYGGYVTLEPHVPADAVPAFYAVEIPFLRSLEEGTANP